MSIKKKYIYKKKIFWSNLWLLTILNSHFQVDLIDFQSQVGRNFKFLDVSIKISNKILYFKPLTSKRAKQISCVLLYIFVYLVHLSMAGNFVMK